ncbi:MAG: hypothetical protein KDC34_14845 [Saprospiraceae bacterium]|nr:hypothetical protein [Saprospiraceae bacterium]
MMQLRYILFCLACLISMPVFSQEPAGEITPENLEILGEYEDTIALLSFAIINDSFPENRFGATQKLIPTLVAALKTPNSFNYDFGRTQSISIQYPQDSTFRVFSWQLYVDVDDYRYYGAIQMNTGQLKLFPLIDRSFELLEPEQQVLGPDQWYGALYYNLKEFKTQEGPMYLLFGYDGLSFFNRRKIVDVLSFVDGKPQFGSPVFLEFTSEGGMKLRNRLVLEYSAEASIKLNYDELLGGIVFDHLIAYGGGVPGTAPQYLPDGSYEGYKLDNGIWMHVPKIFDQISEEAPRPEPIFDDKGRDKQKDIFGREN